jgi:type IV pilus assembly protein PilW
VPTLVRSSFGLDGGLPAHEPAQALIEGIEEFRIELGRDTTTRCGGAIDYTKEIRLEPILLPAGTGSLVDPSNCLYNAASAPRNTLPIVRGDGIPDAYIRCPAAGCTTDQLRDIVAVKIYLVARSKDQTPGYTDTKTYSLGSAPAASYGTDATKFFKRHQFQTTVRLTNVSGRRETPI